MNIFVPKTKRKRLVLFFCSLVLLAGCNSLALPPSSSFPLSPAPAPSEASTSSPSSLPSRLAEYNAAKEQNPDTGGWLLIPDTGIDTVVMHTGSNDDYLRHDFYGNYDIWGLPFIDKYCAPDGQGRNTIIYGHSSILGNKGFGFLFGYRDADYLAAHPLIQLTTAQGEYTYQIFSVFVQPGKGADIFDYTQTDFVSHDEFAAFLQTALEKSEVDTGIQPEIGSKVITLQTCSYDYEGARLVVMAFIQ